MMLFNTIIGCSTPRSLISVSLWDIEFERRLAWDEKRSKPNRWKLPWFWKAGGGPSPYVYGFGYWSSGPESSMGDGLLTYHNLQGRSEDEREKDLVEMQPSRLKAFINWIKVRSSNRRAKT